MSSQWTVLFARLKSWSRFERINKLDRPFSYWPNVFACVLFGIPRDISFLPLIVKRGQRWRASWTRTSVEQLRRSHTQCEHSYWKGNNIIWMKFVALYWGYVNQSTPRILFQLLFFFSVPISFKNNISKIHVWHDNVGEHPGWFLERITIKDVSDGMKWYANSNPYSASTVTNST